MDLRDAKRRVHRLLVGLKEIVARDQEQEVRGMAIPVIEAVLSEAREHVTGDPVADKIRDLVSPEQIESGEPVRAVDAYLVVEQLDAALEARLPGPPQRHVPGWVRDQYR